MQLAHSRAGLVAFAVLTLACRSGSAGDTPARWVDPLIGTGPSDSPNPVPGGAGGSTIPGAMTPFGMLQWSPDTDKASPSGYGYAGTRIQGFSLTHFNGAGCPNGEDIGILPTAAAIVASPGTHWFDYAAPYRHANERAEVGRYQVTLDSGIACDLAATDRVAVAELRASAGGALRVLINPSRNATGTRAASLNIDGRRVTGSAIGGGFCGSDATIPIAFVLEFDRAPRTVGCWSGDELAAGATHVEGRETGAWLEFDLPAGEALHFRVALSYVDAVGAETNLATLPADRAVAEVAAESAARWDRILSRVEVEGASEEDRRKFYTALYHVFSNPNLYADADGRYLGFDHRVRVADGWTNYQNYSGWDIIRSWTHLMSMIAPEMPDIARSMAQAGSEAGLLPFWTDRNMETQVMVGDPGTVNLSCAYAMGVRGFDPEASLELMVRSADDPEHTQRYGLREWKEKHFCKGNAATSLEYAMADYAIARYAAALAPSSPRAAEVAPEYARRATYWRDSWNDADKLIEPRGAEAEVARIYEVEVYPPPPSGSPLEQVPNLALGHPTTASDVCNPNESSEKAVNGSVSGGLSDKWCDNSSEVKWWRVDLGSRQTIGRVVVYHAAAGGESRDWNTRDFSLAVSDDDANWTSIATVHGNRDSVTVHELRPIEARYLRLELTPPTEEDAWGCQPLDPASGCGFIEGNAAQYVWMVPHDLEQLMQRMGGHAEAVRRLDALFTELNAGTNRPYFYIGNEPEHGTPWVYNFAGAPEKAQAVVRRIVHEEFNTTPGGLPGNDDLGATSAWLVWAYLGLYPAVPGSDLLVVHGPYFPRATIQLATGKTLTIEADGAGPDAPYVQSLSVNGIPTTRSWLRYRDLAEGATLRFVMGRTPNLTWGHGVDDLPPSFE